MKIKVTADTVSPTLRQLNQRLGDLSVVFNQYGAYQDRATDNLFKGQKDPYGGKWAKLAPSTVERKRKTGGINKILQNRGHMRATASSKSTSKSFIHGFNDSKAIYHDLGTRKMPKRQLLPDESRGLPKASSDELERLAQRFVNRIWG